MLLCKISSIRTGFPKMFPNLIPALPPVPHFCKTLQVFASSENVDHFLYSSLPLNLYTKSIIGSVAGSQHIAYSHTILNIKELQRRPAQVHIEYYI